MDVNIMSFIVSLLGGGIIGAVISALVSLIQAQREQKVKFLEEQTRELYAPLFYLVAQSEKLFELNKRFHDAYKAEFIDKKYSKNPLTQERLHDSSMVTLEIANKYVRQVEVNNEKISQLLDSKFSYIDPDDIELFLLFFEHRVRFFTEMDAEEKLTTPFDVYDRIGEISYLRPEFIEGVKAKFNSKKNKLYKLLN